jgi:FHS family L-fucose permease-like MFS transporter
MSTKNPKQEMNKESHNQSYSMAVLTSLFFMWGFITVLNDILIPYLKNVFDLNYAQAMLVQLSFFGAYFVGGLIYYWFSRSFSDPINKIGYKNGIILGLIISALGTALFYPAAIFHLYGFFLSALFILGLGFAVLQIAANPYVAILGPEDQASSRLNLSQAFNSLGTTIGPIIGGFLIFEYFNVSNESAESVVKPYLFLTAILLVLALLIKLVSLPTIKQQKAHPGGALSYRHLKLGALAIFLYVGAEVSIGSFLVNFFGLEKIAGMDESAASSYISFYWGGAMIGRFLGAISLSNMQNNAKYMRMFLVSAFTFGLIYFVVDFRNSLAFREVIPYVVFLILNYLAFILGKSMAAKTLTIFSIFPIALLMLSIFSSGTIAFWSVLGIGIFNSIMWSNIFTLAIKGLGDSTSQGSSILVMFIVGGAIIPFIQGLAADRVGLQLSFFVPMLSYFYLAWYGWKGHIVTRSKS